MHAFKKTLVFLLTSGLSFVLVGLVFFLALKTNGLPFSYYSNIVFWWLIGTGLSLPFFTFDDKRIQAFFLFIPFLTPALYAIIAYSPPA